MIEGRRQRQEEEDKKEEWERGREKGRKGRRGKGGEAGERGRQRMVLWNTIWETWIVFSEVLCPINIYVGMLSYVLHPGQSGVGTLDCSVEYWNTHLSIWGDGRNFKLWQPQLMACIPMTQWWDHHQPYLLLLPSICLSPFTSSLLSPSAYPSPFLK